MAGRFSRPGRPAPIGESGGRSGASGGLTTGWGGTKISRDSLAPVAQLDRASGYGPEGWGFESSRAYEEPRRRARLIDETNAFGDHRLRAAAERVWGLLVRPEEVVPAERAERDLHFMRLALEQAEAAYSLSEIPVGCVVVCGDRVVGRGHNRRELDNDPTAHAEMLAIVEAARTTGSWRLDGATLYVTLEPCAMCAGAIVLARIERLVFGALDPKAGACGSLWDIPRDARLNHRVEVTQGVLAEQTGDILRRFFRARRDGTLGKPAPAGEERDGEDENEGGPD